MQDDFLAFCCFNRRRGNRYIHDSRVSTAGSRYKDKNTNARPQKAAILSVSGTDHAQFIHE